MSMLSTRNALVGWAVIKLGKQATKTKKQQAAKSKKGRAAAAENGGRTGRGKIVPAVAVAAASAGGVLLFWRRRSRDASAEGDEPE
jgi:hypothetical protein